MPWLLIPLWIILAPIFSGIWDTNGLIYCTVFTMFLAALMGDMQDELNSNKWHIFDVFSRKPKVTPRPTKELIGATGYTLTTLDLVGYVKIDGKRHLAKSNEGLIPQKQKVEVCNVEHNTVYVSACN